MARENLYFIALMFPDTVSAEITTFKMDMAANYNSRTALKNEPHITLKAPFKLLAERHTELLDWFNHLVIAQKPFIQQLDGFGAFDNPKNPVIFVQPVLNDRLVRLHKEIISAFKLAYPEIALHFNETQFKPHSTIAYRDLEYIDFKKAWTVYKDKEYHAAFTVAGFNLLQHDGGRWNTIAVHNLQ